MSLDLFIFSVVDITVKVYRMVFYNMVIIGVIFVLFLILGFNDYVDLGCSYLYIEFKLKIVVINGLVADDLGNAVSSVSDIRFVYVTNNIGYGFFK